MNQNTLEQPRSKQSPSFPQNQSLEFGRTEVLDGRIVNKPANRSHNIINTNFVVALGSRIQRSNFELYGGGMKVKVGQNSICFPDVVIVSGEPAFADNSSELLTNPTVVIEIYSNASPAGDRTRLLEGFLSIPSIKECLLVNESEMRIEHYARQNQKQWIYRIYNERDDVISLESISCKLNLTEVYSQVKIGDAKLSSKAVN